ncbi:MAG: hydantoinase/oxoprolinase family protein [Gammaproteobacteria bacterium]|nr:hydantoinase/oxoprolinase family protein [Gammaproteobacteria bacterium]
MATQAPTHAAPREFILALDAGGTMTDTILVKGDGSFTIGKSLTNREDEASSYSESVADAALQIGLDSRTVHTNTSVSIYAGTGMLNTILTGTGRKVGLLVTRGFEHITIVEGGLTYLGQTQAEILHQQLHEHTRPLVDPRNVLGVAERICGGSYFSGSHRAPGEELVPLNEDDVRRHTQTLIDRGCEVIGILFINSFIAPKHEHRAKAVAEEVVAKSDRRLPIVCSSDVAPVSRENNRVKSLLFQCFAAELTREALLAVEGAAREDGYNGRLLTLLSYGGAVNVEYQRLYETMVSGPIGGLMGAQIVANKLALRNVVTADMGGTSFDVGLLVDGRLGLRKDADFAGHRLALPMVALDSVGSGAGSAVWIDEYRRLHVGPDSAGAKVGSCFKYDKLTVTDVNVALGYVDPSYFLGGKIALDRDKALKALEETVAKPLGIDVYEAGRGILDVVNTQMRDLALAMMTSKGYDPREFTMICYGGAGPVHMWGFTDGIPFEDVITMPWAAGFSAFGAAGAEYMHRYHRGFVELVPNGMAHDDKQALADRLDAVFRGLEEDARNEMSAEGVDVRHLTFRYGVYARYIGQLESFDTVLDFGHLKRAEDVDRLVDAFEDMYTKVYPVGARFPQAGYSITEVYLQAVAPKPQPDMREYPLSNHEPAAAAFVGERDVYHAGRWVPFKVWQMGELTAGNVVNGPAIIRDPMTTVVVPPGKRIEIDRFLCLHYR